jgi:hypothetical protein
MPCERERFCKKCGVKKIQVQLIDLIPGTTTRAHGCITCNTIPTQLTAGKRDCPGRNCAVVLSTGSKSCSCGWKKEKKRRPLTLPLTVTAGKRECPGWNCAVVVSTGSKSCDKCGWYKKEERDEPFFLPRKRKAPDAPGPGPIPTLKKGKVCAACGKLVGNRSCQCTCGHLFVSAMRATGGGNKNARGQKGNRGNRDAKGKKGNKGNSRPKLYTYEHEELKGGLGFFLTRFEIWRFHTVSRLPMDMTQLMHLRLDPPGLISKVLVKRTVSPDQALGWRQPLRPARLL